MPREFDVAKLADLLKAMERRFGEKYVAVFNAYGGVAITRHDYAIRIEIGWRTNVYEVLNDLEAILEQTKDEVPVGITFATEPRHAEEIAR